MSKTKQKSESKYEFLKSWDDFVNSRAATVGRRPVLMPVNLDIVDGKLVRTRMKAPDVKKLFANCRGEFPAYMQEAPNLFEKPERVFSEYVKYFQKQDGVEGPGEETALDLQCVNPTWMLFNLPRSNWKFSRDVQYTTTNDADDQTRNFEKICTLNKMNCLILANRCRSQPKGLKFNLHVTIRQRENGKTFKTPIIIDPPVLNIPNPPF